MPHNVLVGNLYSIWWIILAAMLAPILALITKKYIPDAIWLLIFGLIIGPHLLKLAQITESIEFLREIGMGLLFLLAGLEVNTNDMRSKQGKHSFITWIICFICATGLGLLITNGQLQVSIVIGIATTSTALGTLLPILKDSKMIETNLGKSVLIHGAYGELLPIITMSLLLSTVTPLESTIILLVFTMLAALIVVTPVRIIRKVPLLGKAILSASHTTMQTTLRITVFILVSLMLLTAIMELDIALGAFVAGIFINVILKTFSPKYKEEIEKKVEIVGFSFLIPVFFITSGMNIDLSIVLNKWYLVIFAVAFILLVRGLIVFLKELFSDTNSGLNDTKEKVALGLYSASGLPVIVAVTEMAKGNNIIDPTLSSIMVTSGAITVLLFPLLAKIILKN
ncbi:cation:proton antiporter [Staphylococcus hyicus]|uniref:cation:proton antiporter n=1 Tax=Staphylococcus TaxID=1279 RepID=UPI00208ED8F8|nr:MULTISPECIES: cation:proton antiporter [Staphylococcus]MCO4327838.1 cation:proton antiporter [Staphylococcus agnetis]MCO4329650.1 cation:proton antiporter [Staphylococcus hyicus]MCO4337404.1 cation:proton antiporter [Staphylococcus hyicus]MCO4351549.1 cation:proton antiporter [Staphylococcus agnetis]MCO4353679.1 cation:proton antiporter [Staphylococcus agnetis]